MATRRRRHKTPASRGSERDISSAAKRYFVASSPCSRVFQHMVLDLSDALPWYTSPMTDPVPLPTPPPETIWPPAPLRDEPPPSLFLRAEEMELTQSGHRLIVVNKLVRRAIPLEICLFTAFFLLPFFLYWINPFHHVRPPLVPYVISSYREILPVYLIMFVFMVCAWRAFYVDSSLGVITLNKLDRIVKANSRDYSLSELEAVRVTQIWTAAGLTVKISCVWSGSNPVPPWPKALTWVATEVNTSLLGTLRQKENADKLAAAIAEFAGVPVQQRIRGKNSV